jgi:ketosteroid isomerase-like protein
VSQANLSLAKDAIAAFSRRDVAGLSELTTEDVEWVTWTGTVEHSVYHGHEGLADYFRDADVWEVLELDIDDVRDLGDRVLVSARFHARAGGSGAEIDRPWYSAFFVSDGKLARVLSYRTEEEALRAAGLRE